HPAAADAGARDVTRPRNVGPAGFSGRVFPRQASHHVGRANVSFRRCAGRVVLRHGDVLQSGRTRVFGQGLSGSRPLCGGSSPPRVLFPMPFFRSARIELIGAGTIPIPDVRWSVRYTPYVDPPNHVAYFHATYRDHSQPEVGKDLILLDTREQEGSEEWSGHFVGTSIIFSHRSNLSTLEGDPRFFFDDSLSPQGYGTGT